MPHEIQVGPVEQITAAERDAVLPRARMVAGLADAQMVVSDEITPVPFTQEETECWEEPEKETRVSQDVDVETGDVVQATQLICLPLPPITSNAALGHQQQRWSQTANS